MIDAIAATQASQNPRGHRPCQMLQTPPTQRCRWRIFLQLLTSQISNQDPLEPMKDTEFISQMANIASLEQMQQFTQGFESFADSQKDMVAQAYLGKMVNISEDGSDVTGLVDSVEKNEAGEVFVTVADQNYRPANITRVSNPNP